MSIAKRGDKWEVRYWEGGKHPSRLFERKKDAEAFELDIKRRRQLGPIGPSVIDSKITLAQFMQDEWWPRYAIPNLKPSTRKRYLEVWGTHLLPRLGGLQLRQINAMMVEDLRDQLARAGLGAASQRKALLLLQAIMRRAVVRQLIPANPVADVDKPKAPPPARPQPLAPATVEAVRALLRPRDATLVSLLAYGGLRPEEATSARWGDLGERTLHVHAGKTGRDRTIDLLAPLAQDLAEWRMRAGRPGERALIFHREQERSRERHTAEWTREDYSNWRRRIYQPAATAAGVTGDMRPYRLRGSYISLLLWSGDDLVYVADQAGHSVATLARHYAGVLAELRNQPRIPAEQVIREARAAVASRRMREAM